MSFRSALKAQVPELRSMEPVNYEGYFGALCWSGTRRLPKRSKKCGKKEKQRRLKAANATPMCYVPSLLGNPSQFAVFVNVRKSILARWRHLHGSISEFSDDSDNDDCSQQTPISKLPKVTGMGLKTVFALISQARFTDANFCEHALKALLDVLQGHSPEELSQEPIDIISSLHAMLLEVAGGSGPTGRSEKPTNLTALSTSCLLALSVARGEAEFIINAIASLIMSAPQLAEQYVQVPANLMIMQRSVQAVVLGKSSRNQWLNFGVPHLSQFGHFQVDLPPQLTDCSEDVAVRSLASDGCYLYVLTSKGLLKFGTGYGISIRPHLYLYKRDFFPSERYGWLGYCKNKLYVKLARKKSELYELDKDTFEVKDYVTLDLNLIPPFDPKTAIFSDGNMLGLVSITNQDYLTIRYYDVDGPRERYDDTTPAVIRPYKEMTVSLLRRHVLIIGRSPFDDGFSRRPLDVEVPVAVELDDNDDDCMVNISAGQDFCLLNTITGKVYYTGKGASLGYKTASPVTSRWTLMKETVYTRNDIPDVKKGRVIQVAVGHEGVHAILVMDNGTALFTGIARRGEDGDNNKHRRTPKPTRPKKILKAEGHYITYAACNYGSTALVTKQGLLLMLGKDTMHCDSTGLVVGLRHERIKQVALGKAHAVALTHFGLVYTFGINNKGQCGRDFGFAKERNLGTPRRQSGNKEEVNLCTTHTWVTEYCRICVICLECTGFSDSCHLSHLPDRIAGENCGCGEGDSGCSTCGVCRRCVEAQPTTSRSERTVTDLDDDADGSSRSDDKPDKGKTKLHHPDCPVSMEVEKDPSVKVSCLPPARVPIPGGQRVKSVACGLHHSVLLTENGDILTFGSNQYGQLGVGDIHPHHRVVRVRVPKCVAVAAGSNHTVLLTGDGTVYTFGCFQKGALGRPPVEDFFRTEATSDPVWHGAPRRIPRLGPEYTSIASSISASGDQTFVQVTQSVLKPEYIFTSTITSNHNAILILPNRPEHNFRCITVNKSDGSVFPWSGGEQADFENSLTCLDPLYDVLWCYHPFQKMIKCYNILTYDPNRVQRCCTNNRNSYHLDAEDEYPNYGPMRRLEDFKNLETYDLKSTNEDRIRSDLILSNSYVLDPGLAIPVVPGQTVTRLHAALHLLGCLDSLTQTHSTRANIMDIKRDRTATPVAPIKEDFQTISRFESHGGGWGYSGHSIEAIRFMCDTDILLGGYGLFGGRGDYSAKIKLFDIGNEGGDQEGDGEMLAETDEVMYECAPRDKFPVLFDVPIPIAANRWYVAWACINGPSSDCGSSGQSMVINDEVGFHFKTSKKSNNGTDVNAGQIPCLLYNTVSPDHTVTIRCVDLGEPIISLSKNVSRKVTVSCFKSLLSITQWAWKMFKEVLLDTNGQIPITEVKLTLMKYQKTLEYVIKACLRLVRCYIIEIHPQHNKKRNSQEYMSYYDAIAETRTFIQEVMAEATPVCSMLPRRPGKNRACFVQFALDMIHSIIYEAHDTITACFHAFFPTPMLKWNHLCSLLFHVKDGVVPVTHMRELASICAAMCASRSLRDVLQYVLPITQNHMTLSENRRPDSKVLKEMPSKSATVPRSSHAQKPPPIPPRTHRKDAQKPPESTESKSTHTNWHLFDAVSKLLDIVISPIKDNMKTRPCTKTHDHGEYDKYRRLSDYSCKLLARIIAELAYNATNIREDQDSSTIKHLVTPSRFMRVNQSRSWNTGNGSPDAICFTVDRPGVMLVGACVFSGLGSYEYSLELLQDLRLRATGEETDPGHCWVSVEMVRGTFTSSDCQHDMVQIKFDRPICLKEDLRYALRLCNHGGRTANGDCGLPSVMGPDGTTFKFFSCSLSFNGTTLARGQIPAFIYYGTSKSQNVLDSPDTQITALRAITLRVASDILERSADLFRSLRNEVTVEDLRRNSFELNFSSVVNTLIPYTLANLEELNDSKSVVKLLESIRNILPHVAAINITVPAVEDLGFLAEPFYMWIESEHPYKQATVSNMRVLFPVNVSWVVLEMDPRSVTAQPEDTLTIYAVAGVPKPRCQSSYDMRVLEPPFRKRLIQLPSEDSRADEVLDEGETETPCMHYNRTYINVTPKLSNVAAEWPKKAIIVPGREVIFSLETASDYLNEYNKSNSEENRFGFRCLCIGYPDCAFTSRRQGLSLLEMELVYAGSACASRLLAPDLEIPPLSFSTIVEVQMLAMMGSSQGAEGGRGAEWGHDSCENLLLSKGLELSSPPSIHQILEGLPLIRSVSTERQFLSDFVAGAESTAGGRLACWLSPRSRVEPSKCEMKPPPTAPQPSVMTSLAITIRDQYGEIVASPALKVEVVVQRMEDANSRQSRSSVGHPGNLPDIPYQPCKKDAMCFQAITMMKPYQIYSFEELRYLSGQWGGSGAGAVLTNNGRVPTERLAIRSQPDGSYIALWTPRAPGVYVFRCTLDQQPTPQELTVEVADTSIEIPEERGVRAEEAAVHQPTPSKFRRFVAKYSAGLRVRASPSLQAEELGRVPPGANIAFIEEVVNKDGTWVRLTEDSARAYTDSSAEIAWCLQYHRHLDKELLVPTESCSPPPHLEYSGLWSACGEDPDDMESWKFDDDDDAAASDQMTCGDDYDRRFPFCVLVDMENEGERSSSPFMFGGEPSKLERELRNEASTSNKGAIRRTNGNGDEWPSTVHRASENVRNVNTIPETDIDADIQDRPMRSDSEEPSASGSRHEYRAEASPSEVASNSHGSCQIIHARNGRRLAQAYTQTSPEHGGDITVTTMTVYRRRHGRRGSRNKHGQRVTIRSGSSRSSTPSSSMAGIPILPSAPLQLAQSPAQAECLRAIFSALLWHEGVVHDAIACAAYLKFHPQLPKQGTRVVTRGMEGISARLQRHSVEVTNAGQYLRLNDEALETLTRAGIEACASRSRKSDMDTTISEDDADEPQPSTSTGAGSSVVNVLPPALRALVALWDAMNDAEEFTFVSDKNKNEESEKNENEDKPLSGIRNKRDSKPNSKTPYSVVCELCGGASVAPPIAAHLRQTHPGCKHPTLYGYDRSGTHRPIDPVLAHVDFPMSVCGQLAKGYELWYIYCDKCRDKSLKAASSIKQLKRKVVTEPGNERPAPTPEVDHNVMKDNALFLLDLAPLAQAEPISMFPWEEAMDRGPRHSRRSIWKPAPQFQCLRALGAAPKPVITMDNITKYYSLGRPPPPTSRSNPIGGGELPAVNNIRVHRSVSMGQEKGRDLANAAGKPPLVTPAHTAAQDTLSSVGSSLLAQPSSALLRLVGGGASKENNAVSAFEPSRVDSAALMKSPVLTFVQTRRDLHAYRQKMDAAIRINTIREYAFEALTWLLRTGSHPSCVHDVMWWFCTALDKYASIVPPPLALLAFAKEHLSDPTRNLYPTASASAMCLSICPGGRSARGVRAAFHAFLGSVSALAPSLPPANSSILQAIRCWALNFSAHDRAFLHRSQVFSMISRILSHTEEDMHDEQMILALRENYDTCHFKENFVWNCVDVTGWCDITVSSRQGMAGALTDGSTETFWESGDEDRNKAKWIQITYAGGTPEDQPHIIAVHIDNTRDTVNKTLLVTYLYAGGSAEMFHMQDTEVDSKSAAWVYYTLPRMSSSSLRVRCELRGPEPAVRVRQIRVLSVPNPNNSLADTAPQVIHGVCESDALRVFRLLTSQVFGKLLDWDESDSDSMTEGAVGGEVAAPTEDSDLREHVVGILFSGHKFTSLQQQVMSHIVYAIGCEATHFRDDWETALLCAEAAERTADDTVLRPQTNTPDNYCFEMLSMLLALSGSAVGRSHLAQQTELLSDLLALLHTGSERVQRQVISLLRRIITEISPQRMLAAVNYKNDLNSRVTLLDHLVAYLGKAMTIQVKIKGLGSVSAKSVTMGTSMTALPPAMWFMKGETTKKHAHLVSKLLSDMAENKLSHAWAPETRSALSNYVLQLGQFSDEERDYEKCVHSPPMWLALAALAVCEQAQVEIINGVGGDNEPRLEVVEIRPFCSNHDDGATLAIVECRCCGSLCGECDRFLHLHRKARNHQRQLCKEEETAIRVDIHEGCGRVKLYWLLLLVDRKTLKGLAEFREKETLFDPNTADLSDGGVSTVAVAGTCRFCGSRSATGLLAIGNVCSDQQCQEHGRQACNRVLSCGHMCRGVRHEPECLPCLFGCSGRADATPLRQDADDMCMICFTDPLQAAPAIQLHCGHVFHLHCCKKVLTNKWNGPRISFSFAQCPICKDDIDHWALEELLQPIQRLREEVKRKALMRLQYEGVTAPGGARGKMAQDPTTYAMERYAYYVCHKCDRAYFGGLARCEAETNARWEPAELVCGACSDVTGARTCPKHGADFLEYKCRYCCSVAVFFCFGTSHFCNSCHDDFQRITNLPKHQLPKCPAGPKGEQLPGTPEACPLHVEHPATGEEYALGCGVCRHAQGF
ncbi:E3 ubiquitin-protein ligase MYCBP2 [Achroia grisella]|uniref:E3 ubiquitin-protein ligase MYCBP2 n=1 Tax=Achroia grisella TaxID=688607 RepID=UPI0027D24305|nr:E3 ubiquitin-protein ligase MYCBP2 [Achroia grisella]